MKPSSIPLFQKTVWQYYHQHGRHDLPWRMPTDNGVFDPYAILVSEVMLQQTQVQRVTPKYVEFLQRYPAFAQLAASPLGGVLANWSGLGYNRRAKFLWQTAQVVVEKYDGRLPRNQFKLMSLPGIGVNTAGAVLAYAFNEPVIFVETNIRTVYIHHFFSEQQKVADAQLIPLLEQSLPRQQVREWYWALMDYGSYLKQTVGNLNRFSTVYTKQSTFHGSRRQLRGQVLRALMQEPLTQAELARQIPDERLQAVLIDLVREGLITEQASRYSLAA